MSKTNRASRVRAEQVRRMNADRPSARIAAANTESQAMLREIARLMPSAVGDATEVDAEVATDLAARLTDIVNNLAARASLR